MLSDLDTLPGTIFICLLPFFPFRGACRAGVDLADTSRFCSSQTHRDEAPAGVAASGPDFPPERCSMIRLRPIDVQRPLIVSARKAR